MICSLGGALRDQPKFALVEITGKGRGVRRTPGTTVRRISSRKRHIFPVVLLIVDAFVAVYFGRRHWFDLSVYHGAVRDWVHQGGHIYDYVLPGSGYGFTYPPVAAVFMLPMAVIGKHQTIVVSVVVNLIATAVIGYLLIDPLARRYGWDRWLALGLGGVLIAAYDPVRDTISYGQINLVLLAIVLADHRLLIVPGRRWGGVGIGLAAAVKLTPAMFVCYLLLGRRRSAGVVAATTAMVATLIGGMAAFGPSRVFWCDALWRTERVGNVASVTNQSLLGFVARFDPVEPDRLVWLLLAGAVAGWWAYRIRRDDHTGDGTFCFALTCVVMCLVSPVTWVHHLVWLLPPLALIVERVWDRRQVGPLIFTVVGYLVLASGIVWRWRVAPTPMTGLPDIQTFLGRNTDFWILAGLFLFLIVLRTLEAGIEDVS
jgi:alpha-1,2-mannosyltransferase